MLFLDELGEFAATVLDMLRQPLEDGVVHVSRARASADLPADFLLVAAMNPCPCGEGFVSGSCRCSERALSRYARRLSGPLLDRFDLAITLCRPDVEELVSGPPSETSAHIAERVCLARLEAQLRGVRCNAELSPFSLDETAPLSPDAAALLERRVRSGSLSARGFHRVRRVARTIADLDGAGPLVDQRHVAEALSLREARSVLLQEATR